MVIKHSFTEQDPLISTPYLSLSGLMNHVIDSKFTYS